MSAPGSGPSPLAAARGNSYHVAMDRPDGGLLWNAFRPLRSLFSESGKLRVLQCYSAVLRGRRFQTRSLRSGSKTMLNAGCGANPLPRFLNMDYLWRPGVDLCWDLSTALPLADHSMNGVYSEHCLEHLQFAACRGALREFKRILKPGAPLRIVVPDAELYLRLYQRHKGGEDVAFPFVQKPFPQGFTPLMEVNRVFRDHGHQYAYDAETLGGMLTDAGFKDVRQESFMRGRAAALLIDSAERAPESLYLEASG